MDWEVVIKAIHDLGCAGAVLATVYILARKNGKK